MFNKTCKYFLLLSTKFLYAILFEIKKKVFAFLLHFTNYKINIFRNHIINILLTIITFII